MKKVFINALPKAGTNLLAKCFTLAGYKSCGGVGSFLVTARSWRARFRRFWWHDDNPTCLVGIDTPVEVPRHRIEAILKKIDEQEFIVGHVGYNDEILRMLLKLDFLPLMVIRDPRAILASFVAYVQTNPKHVYHKAFRKLDLEERMRAVVYGKDFNQGRLLSLRDRCRGLVPWLHLPRVQVVKFEEIVGSAGGGSDRRQHQVLASIFERAEIPQKAVKDVTDQLFGPGRATFRKGQIDSWKEEIPESIQEEVNSELDSLLREWGYVR